jgi:2-oxo-3-hexenedioate decarboxylase
VPHDIQELADELAVAEREGKAIAPLSDTHPDLDTATAYDVQQLVVAGKVAAGQRVVGAKLGLTSRAKQQVMGVADPLYGWITDAMISPYGEAVDISTLIQPRVEPEIAFLLARGLTGPAVTVVDVLAATEQVFAGIDVLDSRYVDYRFTLPDVVADNCSAGRFLLGSRAVPPDQVDDLRLVGCVLRSDGEVLATAAGAASMGHPAAAVAWLANRLAARGESLAAGSIVFSGGLTAPVPLRHGHSVTAEFDGLGTVEVCA